MKTMDALQLDRVAFYGRTLSEYLRIFDINLSSLKGCKILDCPAGPCSFVAEATQQGIHAVGCDPLYGDNLKVLVKHGEADIAHVIERTALVPHLYNWDFYPSLDAVKEYRYKALRLFEADYPDGFTTNRYVKAALPRLPFKDKEFDLVLSGHFLFTYSDKFDYSFHLASVLELFRVCSEEVRIYPIQGLKAQPYEHMQELLSDLNKEGIRAKILPVPFEFQRGSDQTLNLMR